MSPILLGVIPVFALIALGWGLKASSFLKPEDWPPIERLAYFALYPGFLVPTIWAADFTASSVGTAGAAAVLCVIVVSGLAVLAKPLLGQTDPAFTSVFQGVVRWNGFVFLPVVGAVFGAEGLAAAAVVLGVLIPVVNVLCVLVLSKWGEGMGGGWRLVGRSLLVNPIIWSCAVGTGLNLLRVPPVDPLHSTLELVGGAAIPLGLVIAGAGLSFRDAAARPLTIAGVTAVKLIVMPLAMWWVTRLMGGDQLAQGVALCCGAAPGAAASYVLARQMGGDAPLMAGVVAFTTAGSAVTIPLLLGVFQAVG